MKLVGVGGGVAYGTLGPTHHAIEDIALMRALPGLTVLTPGDPNDAYLATLAAAADRRPRVSAPGQERRAVRAPRGHRLHGRPRASSSAAGATSPSSAPARSCPKPIAAADRLAARGIDATLVHFGTVKPLDAAAVLAAAARCPFVVTAEEHTVMGGFGSAVAEALAEHGAPARLHRVGLRDEFAHAVGSRAHLVRHYGLDADAIASAAAPSSTDQSQGACE